MSTVAVTDANFEAEVKNSDVPVLVDFWAEWCGPCKTIAPALEELSAEYAGKLKVAKLNVDENPAMTSQLGIRSIPSLFIFKDGQVVSNKVGAVQKGALKTWIDEAL